VPVIQVLIDEENFIYVNNRITDLGGVRAQIERLHAESPQSAVLVQAHPRSKSGIAVAIIDKARVAEVPVSFVLSDVN
jgi:biopolymer transport protein ExbD